MTQNADEKTKNIHFTERAENFLQEMTAFARLEIEDMEKKIIIIQFPTGIGRVDEPESWRYRASNGGPLVSLGIDSRDKFDDGIIVRSGQNEYFVRLNKNTERLDKMVFDFDGESLIIV